MGKLINTVDQISESHVDVTIFGIIMAICEGSFLLDPKSERAAERIMAICQQQSARLVDRHDAGRAALSSSVTRSLPAPITKP